ncbi:LacI family transcriptional regulator [Actinomadura logoneensis]|uniref:LacI family transcriptional regulator n=1 Tax=Actinomadura logoneensis TaxID=2293572 RepID=A0A372JPP8_9ACTN|nr:LacI family DNA-binding transcriptional regulator [Actinomadura logoneensis]RFU41786.1 LacI family transcriptional regulator [Actinomadura logoneensis]
MPYPTLEDVAARAGVSRALVSLVMRGSPKVGEARRAAVLAAARELGYRPNAMARGLAAGRTGIVGVLLDDLGDPLAAGVHEGLAEGARDRELRLLLGTGRGEAAAARTALDELLDLRPDGLVLAGARLTSADLDRATASCPVVAILPPSRADRADTVRAEPGGPVHLAVEHLVALGHRRIAVVDAGRRPSPLRRVYRGALKAHGIDAPVLDLAALRAAAPPTPPGGAAGDTGRLPTTGPAPSEPPSAEPVSAELMGSELMGSELMGSEPVSAVVALGDPGGAAVLTTLLRAGRRVPQDVSVIAHGEAREADAVGVTTVAVPARELGRRAMAALLDRLDGGDPDRRPVRATVPPVLTNRGSTGPVRPAGTGATER